MRMEEYAYVLDFLPTGKPMSRSFEPIAQVLGEKYFTLLEVIIKKDKKVSIGQKIGIGRENREFVEKIKRRIQFNELTSTSKSTLNKVLEEIVESRESEFVNFFNKCGPMTLRLHQLELLPGIGRKHMEEILREREKRPFESFDDIKNRISLIPDPVKTLIDRIMLELEGRDKYYLFVRPPIFSGEQGRKSQYGNRRYHRNVG